MTFWHNASGRERTVAHSRAQSESRALFKRSYVIIAYQHFAVHYHPYCTGITNIVSPTSSILLKKSRCANNNAQTEAATTIIS